MNCLFIYISVLSENNASVKFDLVKKHLDNSASLN